MDQAGLAAYPRHDIPPPVSILCDIVYDRYRQKTPIRLQKVSDVFKNVNVHK